MKKAEDNVWVRCSNCGNETRNHRILFEHEKSFVHDEAGWLGDTYHQLIECMGCETVRYRRFSKSPDYLNEKQELEPCDICIFPTNESDMSGRAALEFGEDDNFKPLVPENVVKMYRETIVAMNCGARTLAGGGLRATVEAICLALGITNGNLQKKIDELGKRDYLTKAQADLMHEERYLGNSALHELATPSKTEIEDGLQIIEGLINTIYVLPAKAKRLRKKRESGSQNRISKGNSRNTPRTRKK